MIRRTYRNDRYSAFQLRLCPNCPKSSSSTKRKKFSYLGRVRKQLKNHSIHLSSEVIEPHLVSNRIATANQFFKLIAKQIKTSYTFSKYCKILARSNISELFYELWRYSNWFYMNRICNLSVRRISYSFVTVLFLKAEPVFIVCPASSISSTNTFVNGEAHSTNYEKVGLLFTAWKYYFLSLCTNVFG